MGTREQWLNDAVDILRPIYEPQATVPEVKVSIGFPPKKGVGKHRVLGVCFVADAAADRIHQIYINPTVAETGGADGILSILMHELIHACGVYNHGKEFRKVALYIGLEGNMRSSTASEDLQNNLFKHIIKKLGTFPHAYLENMLPGIKPDKCRMFKCECRQCGYTVRVARKWIDIATPVCPVCDIELEKEEK